MDYHKAIVMAKEQNRIILPPLIHHDEYEQVMNLLMIARESNTGAIELYIAGYGGHTDLCFGIINWIQHDYETDSGVEGHLIGTANSCHAAIWAACSKLYFYSHSFLGVHPTRSLLENMDCYSAKQELKTLEKYDDLILSLYANSSNKSKKWWRKKYRSVSNTVYSLSAVELAKIGMGEML